METGMTKIFRVDQKAWRLRKAKPTGLVWIPTSWKLMGANVSVWVWSPSGVELERFNDTSEVKKSMLNSLLLRGGWSSCSLQTFNWLDKAHSHYGKQYLLSKSTDLNVNLIQKHPHRNI